MSFFETIDYEVLEKVKNIEIRKYNGFLLAATKTTKNKRQDSGFSTIFNFISGGNDKSEKISMTTPVVTYSQEDSIITGFYVPEKYTKDSLLKPLSKNVFIDEMDKALYAVIKFRGRWNEKNYDKHDKKLKTFLENSKYVIDSTRMILRYNPPIIPSIFRHNEIAYKIKRED